MGTQRLAGVDERDELVGALLNGDDRLADGRRGVVRRAAPRQVAAMPTMGIRDSWRWGSGHL